jgi:AcrR family transcriptional regulator
VSETLRDQQRRIVRERIFDAVAAEIVENGLMNLSIQSVADRAGVSHRTVYNHFENKDVLVQELARHVTDEMAAAGGRHLPDDLDNLPDSIRSNWRLFESAGVKSEALARVMLDQVSAGGGYSDSESSHERTVALRDAVRRLRPDLNSEQIEAIMAVIRIQISFNAWYRLTHEFGLDSETAGAVSAWAFRVLRDALQRNDGPFD